jgi:diguanylate cyclase (GGDEF)-like protein
VSSLLLRERAGAFAAFVILCVLGASWLPTYLAGGASIMPPLWFFVPILLAGVRFGTGGAALAAVAATLLAGPLTPGDVAHDIAQQQSDWLIRGGFFLGIGLVMASVTQRLQREADENRHGREETQAMRDEDARIGALQREFSETLQVARTEDEAHQIVKRHVQRSISAAKVVVLSRNNSDRRLEPVTAIEGGPDIQQLILDATPESCLAVRFGREHQRGPDERPLLECEVCGQLPGRSTCVPSLVGGHVIGSVLVEHAAALAPREKQRISESVSQAAPVLANLRNLAMAETRAATDALTGLPNRRAAENSLKQMAARAGRSVSPLSAVLVDLDHFKLVNDRHGHNRGDELLAAVGSVFSSELRAGDFAARYGGEEFLLLLPDTGTGGAEVLAEKLRASVEAIALRGIEAPTASFGIATIPDHAADAEMLVRQADRAMYRAKEAGRNRIESSPPTA